jgi:hypothetical protein
MTIVVFERVALGFEDVIVLVFHLLTVLRECEPPDPPSRAWEG